MNVNHKALCSMLPFMKKQFCFEDYDPYQLDDSTTPHSYICLVCNRGPFADKVGHDSDALHFERMIDYNLDLKRVKAMVRRYIHLFSKPVKDEVAELDEIQAPAWRDDVQAGLYRYLVSSTTVGDDDEFEEPGEKEPDHAVLYALLEQPLKKLRLYNHCERLSILALAVWKAQCLLCMPPQETFLSSQEWTRSGWKACKADQQNTNAMGIIVESVRPFLDSPGVVPDFSSVTRDEP